ncbi:Uncharacterised protein [Mycobacteroides abscessus subsp. abscessus]|nr:Uncharacterised protein [Mycobacteroides abscessus subsp. abscessus]
MIQLLLNQKWYPALLNLLKNVLKVTTLMHVNVYLNTMKCYVSNVKLSTMKETILSIQRIVHN